MFTTGQKVMLVVVGVLTLWSVAHTVVQADAQSQCLAQGYPQAKVDWKFNQYCVSYDFRTVVKK